MTPFNPENEEGNIEYKRQLNDNSPERIERLATQMRYRCNEGGSECIYNLGVDDDGTIVGITKEEYETTINCLKSAADKNKYSVSIITSTPVDKNKNIYEILVREINDHSYIDIKVAIAGSVDCGKSTLLSVLINGKPDDGRGSARLNVFNYAHEISSGRTSSIGHQILGYDNQGNTTNQHGSRNLAWPDIVKKSTKVISFFDLAGHEKYLKTTIFGLSSSQPDLCMIMVGANRGVLKMTREHIFLCKTLHIPFCIVITKIDMVQDRLNVLQETIDSINKIIKSPGLRRTPIKVKTSEDIVRCIMNIQTETIVPIFLISNTTLEGIPHLHKFLNLTPQRQLINNPTDNVEYYIDSSWNVPGVGTVIGGYLTSGKIKIGDKLFFGPHNNSYTQITVRSIHCKRVPVQQIDTNCYVCIGVKGIAKQDIRKGTVVISNKNQQILCDKIHAQIEVLRSHSTNIKVGYQPLMHALTLRTSVVIDTIISKHSARSEHDDDNVLRTGDSAEVILRLWVGKQFIKPGTRILLSEGRTKVIGQVTKLEE